MFKFQVREFRTNGTEIYSSGYTDQSNIYCIQELVRVFTEHPHPEGVRITFEVVLPTPVQEKKG